MVAAVRRQRIGRNQYLAVESRTLVPVRGARRRARQHAAHDRPLDVGRDKH